MAFCLNLSVRAILTEEKTDFIEFISDTFRPTKKLNDTMRNRRKSADKVFVVLLCISAVNAIFCCCCYFCRIVVIGRCLFTYFILRSCRSKYTVVVIDCVLILQVPRTAITFSISSVLSSLLFSLLFVAISHYKCSFFVVTVLLILSVN